MQQPRSSFQIFRLASLPVVQHYWIVISWLLVCQSSASNMVTETLPLPQQESSFHTHKMRSCRFRWRHGVDLKQQCSKLDYEICLNISETASLLCFVAWDVKWDDGCIIQKIENSYICNKHKHSSPKKVFHTCPKLKSLHPYGMIAWYWPNI